MPSPQRATTQFCGAGIGIGQISIIARFIPDLTGLQISPQKTIAAASDFTKRQYIRRCHLDFRRHKLLHLEQYRLHKPARCSHLCIRRH